MTNPRDRTGPLHTNGAFAIGVVLNVAVVGGEAAAAVFGNSTALLADAGHNLTDVLSLALAGVSAWLARRPASARRTYGFRRATILAALTNGVILILVSAGLVWTGVARLLAPEAVHAGILIWAAAAATVANGATALLFLRGRGQDLNVRAAFLHMTADAVLSLGVVGAAFGILATGWLWLDPAMSLAIVVAILWSTWSLLRDSLDLSLDAVPRSIDPESVKAYLRSLPAVADVHHLHVWAMSTTEVALTAHLVKPDGVLDDALLARVKQELREHFGIAHIALQLECGGRENPCGITRTSAGK
jgi:cobalt-zinc-cadmium efflux system protein